MLRELRIENFRSHKVTSIPLGRWTILYGENGAGKSSLLDAMNIVSSFATGTALKHLFPPGVYSASGQVADPSKPEILLSVELEDDLLLGKTEMYRYELVVGGQGPTAVLNREELFVEGDSVLTAHAASSTSLATSGCGDAEAAQALQAHLMWARRYRLEPRLIRRTSSNHHFIDKQGFGIPSAVDHLKSTNPTAYAALISDFLALFPAIADLRTVQVGSGEIALEFDTGTSTSLSGVHLSDGQALAFGLLFLAHSPEGPRMLLLDEPEVTLSPVLVKDLLGRIEDALTSDRQVLLTTHSPYVIQWGITNDAQVRQVRDDFGTRSWADCLRQQAVDPDSLHSTMTSIEIATCCALLETYLVG